MINHVPARRHVANGSRRQGWFGKNQLPLRRFCRANPNPFATLRLNVGNRAAANWGNNLKNDPDWLSSLRIRRQRAPLAFAITNPTDLIKKSSPPAATWRWMS